MSRSISIASPPAFIDRWPPVVSWLQSMSFAPLFRSLPLARAFPSLPTVLALMLALSILQGCAILSPPPPRDGGSTISDAAREAKKKEEDKHERLVADDAQPDRASVFVDIDDCDHSHSRTRSSEGRPERHENPLRGLHVGLVTGAGAISGDAFNGFGLGGLQVGGRPTPRTRIDGTLFGIPTRLTRQGSLGGGLRNEIEIAADVSARYELTPDDVAIGVYPIVGFRMGTLLWDYASPIVVDDVDGPKKIEDDWLSYYAPYAGLGTSFLRAQHFQMGVNLTGGFRFYEDHTQEGLRNDTFRKANFFQVMLETTYRF